jgi:acyl-CoA thioesterase
MSDGKVTNRCAEAMYANDDASRMLGISVEVEEAGRATARMTVREDMLNGFDVCHGGLIFALADTAFAFACNGYDDLTYAAQADIEFVRPATKGDALVAVAREDYRGRKTGFYTVEVTNQDDQLVAMFRGRSASKGEPLL